MIIQWLQGYPFYLMMGSALGIYMAYIAYKDRKTPGGRYLWIILFLSSASVLTTAFELLSDSFEIKLWWRNIQQIPIFLCALFAYAFAKDYIQRSNKGMNRQLLYLSIPLIMYFTLILTDQFHHLMRKEIGLELVGGLSGIWVQPTIVSQLFIVYSQILSIFAIIILVVNLKNTSKLQFKQHFIFIMGLGVPIVMILLLPLLQVNILGATSLSLLIGTCLVYYGFIKFNIFTIWPISKDRIFEHLKDGIILVNAHDTIIDLNPAAEKVLSSLNKGSQDMWIGEEVTRFIHNQSELYSAYLQKDESKLEMLIWGDKYFEVIITPIKERARSKTETLLIFSDITDKKKYEKDLIRWATIDDLTGIFNRRYFIDVVNNQLIKMKEGSALFILDIDNFKEINDIYGHVVGDKVLSDFSDVLNKMYLNKGIVGRIGGEEFGVLFTETSEEDCQKEAEQLRRSIESFCVSLDQQNNIHITASIGVTYTESKEVHFKELYHKADRALYISKETGKNNVTYGGKI